MRSDLVTRTSRSNSLWCYFILRFLRLHEREGSDMMQGSDTALMDKAELSHHESGNGTG